MLPYLYRCLFRLCKHPRLDSITAGTSGEERLALLLEKMANSSVRKHAIVSTQATWNFVDSID